jgi:Mn2+/Fe2+ NRAMP family transporter
MRFKVDRLKVACCDAVFNLNAGGRNRSTRGVAMNFVGVDAVKALYWSAVVNGMLAPPLMAVIMLLACNPRVMSRLVLPRSLRIGGWAATAVMGLAAAAMMASWFV